MGKILLYLWIQFNQIRWSSHNTYEGIDLSSESTPTWWSDNWIYRKKTGSGERVKTVDPRIDSCMINLLSMKLCANWQESFSIKGLEENPKLQARNYKQAQKFQNPNVPNQTFLILEF